MADDPLLLGGLDTDVIEAQVETRKATKGKKDSAAAMLRAETAAKKEERLSKEPSIAPPPMTTAPEPPVQDKSLLLDKIQAYRERFVHIKSRNKVSGRSSIDELEDELHYIEQQLGQKEGHMGTSAFLLTLSGIEQVTMNHYNPLGLNLTGLSKVAQDNQGQFAPILDELFIKYATNVYVGPEMRLAMATATLMYTVHSANTGNPTMARAMEAMAKEVVGPANAKDL